MKKLLIGSASVVVLLGVGLVVLPSLVPSSVYKEKIENQLSQELDRDVRIIGDVKLSVFPVLKANTGRVEIDNPEGFGTAQFASMDAMSAGVKLLPLFSKRVEITSFTLKNPTINLEKMADGTVNWAFGDTEAVPEPAADEGPFKRDGRYANIDPSIGKFSIQDGQISYLDNATNASHKLENVNVNFVLTGLADPLEVEGDFIFDGTAADVDISVASLRNFLDGKESAISADLETDFAKLQSSGRFLAGQDIAFNLDVDGNVSSIKKLLALIPSEIKYADIAETAALKGNYNYDGKVLSAKGANITAKGPAFDATFAGDALLAETPVLDGTVKLNAFDIASLAKSLELDVKGINLVNTANVTADLSAQDKGFSAQNVKADVKGTGLDGTFLGTVNFDGSVQAKGDFTAKADSVPSLVKALELDIPQTAAVQAISLSGAVDYNEASTTVSNLDVSTTGGALTGSYKGAVQYDGTVKAQGNFDANTASVPELVKLLSMDIPQAGAVEAINLSGAVDYSEARTALSNLDVSTTGGPLTGSYKGSATLAETVGFSGDFTAALASLPSLSQRTGIEVPYAAAIGVIDASGKVSGQGETLSIQGLSASLKDGLINGNYTGNVALNKGVNLDGRLNADIPSLRKLAASTGNNTLPPSTAAGQIYEAFSVSGNVKGSPEKISFNGAELSVDAIKANGDFVVDMSKAKPLMTASLALNGLDINPYTAAYSAQNPSGEIQPWSNEPLNFAALNAVDGTFNLSTPNVKTGRIALGQSDIKAKLQSGVLSVDLPNMALYGGSGSMAAVVNAASSVPSVSFDMNLQALRGEGFLGAVAGFTNATGTTGTSIKFRGQGRSQSEIMKSLGGDGDFKMVDGRISGVDLQALLSGLDTALTSRTIPGGIGPSEFTGFQDIIGKFSMTNGVATVDTFNLQGLGVAAEGGGKIDIGQQNIDFSLRPRLIGKNANDIASFGIPIRVQGGFGSAKVGLDTNFLSKIVADQARAKASALIQEQVGGNLGGVLGGVLGGQGTAETGSSGLGSIASGLGSGSGGLGAITSGLGSSGSSGSTGLGSVTSGLGGLGAVLGGGTSGTQTTTQGTASGQPQNAQEEAVKDVLGGLFGKKKKKE